jgi:hypothetical protein
VADDRPRLTPEPRRATGRQPTPVRTWYGPTVKAFVALEGTARDALERDLVALARRLDRLGGDAVAIPAAYTETIAVRR